MSKKPDIRKCREVIKDSADRESRDPRFLLAGFALAEKPFRKGEIPPHLRPLWNYGMSAGISLGHNAPAHRPLNYDDDVILKKAMQLQLEAYAAKMGRPFEQDWKVLDDGVEEILDKRNYPIPLIQSVAQAKNAAGTEYTPSSTKHMAYVKFKADPGFYVFEAADEIFDHELEHEA